MTVLLCFALAASLPASSSKVLVLDVAGETLTKDERGVIRDRLAAEVSKRKNVEVISSEDMRRVLDVEAQKQAAGCAGENDCLAEIGAALGADRVLYASVGRLGGSYVVNLALVDPLAARSVGRDTFQVGSLEEASAELPDAARRVFGRPSSSGSSSSSSSSRRPPDRGAPVVTITGGVIAGVGAVATAGLGIATFLMADTLRDPSAGAAAKQSALDQGPLYLTATAVSGGVLGLGAVVTVVGLLVE